MKRGERRPLLDKKGGPNCYTALYVITTVVLFISGIVAIVNFARSISNDSTIGALRGSDDIFDRELTLLNVTSGVYQTKDQTLMDQFMFLLQTLFNETDTRTSNDQQFAATLEQNTMDRQNIDQNLNDTLCDAIETETVVRENADVLIDDAIAELEVRLNDVSNTTTEQANQNALDIALLKNNVTALQAKDMLLMQQLFNGTQFGFMLKNDTSQIDMWLMQTLVEIASTDNALTMLLASINSLNTTVVNTQTQATALDSIKDTAVSKMWFDFPIDVVPDAMQTISLLGTNLVTMSGMAANEITVGSGSASVVSLEAKTGDVILNGQSANIDITTTASNINIDAVDTDTQRPSGKHTSDSGLNLDFDWQFTIWPAYLSQVSSTFPYNTLDGGGTYTTSLNTFPAPASFPAGICFFEIVMDATINSIQFTQEYWYKWTVFASIPGLNSIITPQCTNTIRFQVRDGLQGRPGVAPETTRTRCTVWVPSPVPYQLSSIVEFVGADDTQNPGIQFEHLYRTICNPE